MHAKWSGRCDACGGWNTIAEEAASAPIGPGARKSGRGRPFVLEDLKTDDVAPQRRVTAMAEFDRVCGGGLVPGSALLIGGDPGVGKSTLILQALASYAQQGGSAVYISGEEAMAQVRLRAARMGLASAPVALGSATCVEDILATLERGPVPGVVAIDSIQTIWTSALEAAPGTIAQVRTASFDLVRYAKASGAALLLVGHVTKEGQIAGPKQVEHLVDAVLYFEGERGHHFRVLRAVKNRFGPTDEIGVFEMTGKGLAEVANPSALFLGDRTSASPGTAVFAGIEGTRPLLMEIQALVAPAGYGTPRRAVVGWDTGRLAMILAVLDARAGVEINASDVYLNVAGGLKVGEPAADVAAAVALISSFNGQALPKDTVYFGEISLSGDVRPAPQAELRLKEAAKLGFSTAVVPKGMKLDSAGLKLVEVRDVGELMAIAGAAGRPLDRRGKLEIMSLAFTYVDLLTVIIVIVSAIYAIYRGFIAETLSIVAWAAAAFASLYFGPLVAPLLRGMIQTDWIADVAAYALVFVAVLIPISFASHRFSRTVQHSAAGPLDQALGFVFGIVRGLAIVGLAYLVFTWFVPTRGQPKSIRDARLLPLIQSTSEVILALVPDQDQRDAARDMREARPDREPGPQPNVAPMSKPAKTAQISHRRGRRAYGARDRRALDRLIEATGNGGDGKP